MHVFVLLDSHDSGESILFLSTDRKVLENKKLDIELSENKYEMDTEMWADQLLQCKIAAGFEETEYNSVEYQDWLAHYRENFPPIEPPVLYICGELVIKEYECI